MHWSYVFLALTHRYEIGGCTADLRSCVRSSSCKHQFPWWRHQMQAFSALHIYTYIYIYIYWPFVRRIHWSPVDSPHKGQWHGALMFSLICAWTNDWANNRDAGDLRRNHAHYGITVMPRTWYRQPLQNPNRTLLNLVTFHILLSWKCPFKKLLHQHPWAVSSSISLSIRLGTRKTYSITRPHRSLNIRLFGKKIRALYTEVWLYFTSSSLPIWRLSRWRTLLWDHTYANVAVEVVTVKPRKGSTFPRRHFQMHLLEWKCLNFEYILTEVCSQGTNWQ